jgi:class 3 adenylate cyclase
VTPPARLGRLLVVDDNPAQLEILRTLLGEIGYDVRAFTRGLAALAAAEADPPELFLLDITMPEIDGITLCRRLKANERLHDIPVIFISGLTETNSIVTGLEAGGVDYIAKPFRVQEVHARVKTHLALIAERRKVEELLRNILPDRVIRELKKSGQTTPEFFEHLTIFFSDFVNFTRLTSESSPPFLIGELNRMFTAFDEIMARNACERIKTVGDAYLAVGGNFASGREPALRLVRAAVEIADYLDRCNREARTTGRSLVWQVRIGLHTGDAVGAVVGTTKYLYDLFGDGVNTAARIQGTADPMGITVSEATWELVKDSFEFRPRPPVDLRGKGFIPLYDLVRPLLESAPTAPATGDDGTNPKG